MRPIWLAQTLIFAALCCGALLKPQPQVKRQDEEQTIRVVLARFYEGWNARDADKMAAVYAVNIDHINVFGEWQKGRATLRQELARLHAGPLRDSQKTYTIEKIRFLKPDVAVVQVSTQGTSGPNLGTYVMEKCRAARPAVEEVRALRPNWQDSPR